MTKKFSLTWKLRLSDQVENFSTSLTQVICDVLGAESVVSDKAEAALKDAVRKGREYLKRAGIREDLPEDDDDTEDLPPIDAYNEALRRAEHREDAPADDADDLAPIDAFGEVLDDIRGFIAEARGLWIKVESDDEDRLASLDNNLCKIERELAHLQGEVRAAALQACHLNDYEDRLGNRNTPDTGVDPVEPAREPCAECQSTGKQCGTCSGDIPEVVDSKTETVGVPPVGASTIDQFVQWFATVMLSAFTAAGGQLPPAPPPPPPGSMAAATTNGYPHD